ncbi:amidohydrolase family protein [Spelaeicoccus albus]|uniref:Cytosine/adenosine deaminase-related metal-dependent hydrolase n=1 Tax=Spelaeicoccus albus TaxID=1280376 RepID=A0A7Z0II99_9MICO|nr:amidohydrolase family protein [Spelaeicoccus albus]NYI68254.1 cytosine/adenosine deaminase-related metal-dependent hydrolase [Spelaeicoccus albus]
MSNQHATVIRNATILSMDRVIGDLPSGDLLIEGGVIAAVGTDLDAPADAKVVDASGSIVVPGFIDTHRHMWEAILRGYAPDHTFGDYMSHVLGVAGPALTPDELHDGELLSARAGLAAGVTTIQDISNIQDSPAHTDAIVSALQDSGLRAVLAYGLSFPTMTSTGASLPDDVRRVRSRLLPRSVDLVTMALDAEGGDDVSEQHNAALARELDLRIARHFSERLSARHLADLGALVPGTTFIHGNGLDDEELRVIADGGGNISIAPAIEMVMGHGFPVIGPATRHPDLLVSLSSDVEVTMPGDMFTQMRAALASGRHHEHTAALADRPTLGVREVLRMATIDGARALGLDGRTGSLTPGKEADLVVLDAERPDAAPVYDPYSTVVLQMDRSHVDTVYVRGVPRVQGGVLVGDDTDLLERAAHTADRLVRDGVVPAPLRRARLETAVGGGGR